MRYSYSTEASERLVVRRIHRVSIEPIGLRFDLPRWFASTSIASLATIASWNDTHSSGDPRAISKGAIHSTLSPSPLVPRNPSKGRVRSIPNLPPRLASVALAHKTQNALFNANPAPAPPRRAPCRRNRWRREGGSERSRRDNLPHTVDGHPG